MYFNAAAPAIRSGWREYLEQVRDIAPRDGLLGRSAELAEMAAFCNGLEHYWWWRAEAWAGKSALLSWFVLNPPADVVAASFFVTARYASQDDSTAFVTALLGQLAELLGQELPEPSMAGGLAGRYRLLLRAMAQHAQQQGKRLVLVVDGLDEDRGTDAGLPSIASLLPKYCEHGLKVIVASRPHPPIPPDVAADHPLRSPAFARTLSRSRHAQVIRDAAELELRSLLNGTRVRQELLGLLTAALGGLTLADLAELTGLAPFDIRQTLRGVTGRTFTTRSAEWARSDEADRVYLLAHETLQAQAADAFGEQRLSVYRGRLNTWARTYQSKGWPADTPLYLLRGYFRMLQAIGDTTRLISCAVDPARHDRMLALSYSDATARSEIATATVMILAQPDPDLTAMARLAIHRDNLTKRNEHLPGDLPAVWATVGQPARAEALADSMGAYVLASVARALAAAGLHERARQVADRAETRARSITDARDQLWALANVAQTLAATGLYDRAETLARSITRDYWVEPANRDRDLEYALYQAPVRALAQVAKTLAAAGLHDRARKVADEAETLAETLADSITDPGCHPSAVAWVAEALAAAGLHDRARQVAARAETLIGPITFPQSRVLAMANVTKALAATGLRDRAEALADSIPIPYDTRDLVGVAPAVAAAGLRDRAEALALLVPGPAWQARELASVAAALAAAGLHDSAVEVADHAETLAREVGEPESQAQALAWVARALAAAGLHDRAEALARSITIPDWQARPLVWVAKRLAAAGLHERARQLADRAETLAREVGVPYNQAGAPQAEALAALAEALAAAGLQKRARQVAEWADTLARSFTNPLHQLSALVYAAQALAAAGLYDRAETLARSITFVGYHADALAGVAKTLAAAGLHERARKVADEAETFARSVTDPDRRPQTLAAAAEALAAAGLHDRADTVAELVPKDSFYYSARALAAAAKARAAAGLGDRAETLADSTPFDRDAVSALAGVAEALAAAGFHDRARQLADHCETYARSRTGVWWQGALADTAKALAAAGLHDRAETLARSITRPWLRAEALAGVAEAIAAAGQTVRAQHLLALALSTGPCAVSLRTHLLPVETLTAVADLLLPPASA